MIRTATFFVLIILCLNQVYSQDNAPSAKEILTKYIQVIGGKQKIQKISSYKIIQESSSKGIYSTFEKKVIKHEALLVKNNTGDITRTAIVKKNGGVNITPKGIFNMPDNQVEKFEIQMMIIPELTYLETDYKLEYMGFSELNDTVNIHEIRITNSKGKSEVRAYDASSGLLSMIMSSDKQLTTFSDYKKIKGVLFPFTEKVGSQILHTKEIAINKKIRLSEFEWNNKTDLSLIGGWIAKKSLNDHNQTEYTEIKLDDNRGGTESMGVFMENGEKESLDFLTQKIVGWKFSNDTLKMDYYNTYKKEFYSRYLVLTFRDKDEFTGYFSDPEKDKVMSDGAEEFEPVLLKFRRITP